MKITGLKGRIPASLLALCLLLNSGLALASATAGSAAESAQALRSRGANPLTSLAVTLAESNPRCVARRFHGAIGGDGTSQVPAETSLHFAEASRILQSPGSGQAPARKMAQVHRGLERLYPQLRRWGALPAKLQASILKGMVSNESFREQKRLFDLFKAYNFLADAYDRGQSHSDFLTNTARLQEDKARLLSYARGPTILEVGPGGGTNLLHLDKRRKEDPSVKRLVALEGGIHNARFLEGLRRDGRLSATVLYGNAVNLTQTLRAAGLKQVDTVVLSSVLHEIFSYSQYEGRHYNIRLIEHFMREVLSNLAPGGRLLLRDPVEPEDGGKLQRLVLKGRASEAFDLFQREFQARPVPFTLLREDGQQREVLLRKKDLSEFIFKLTWGPRAFPSELQEQYGVLTRSGWVRLLEAAARAVGTTIAFVPLPEELASYLQPGYQEHLSGLVELREADGTPAAWPDSNMAVVVEKVNRP